MLNPYVALGVFSIEMLICYLFFSNVFSRRRSYAVCLVTGALCALLSTAGNLLSHNSGVVNTVTSSLLPCLFVWYCFRAKLFISFFYCLILVVVSGTIETFVISGFSVLLGTEFLDYNTNWLLFSLECSLSKILYFLVVLILCRIARPDKSKSKLPINLFFYPVACAVCLMLFWNIITQPGTSQSIRLGLSAAGILHMFSVIMLFITYQHQLEKESKAIHMRGEVARLQMEKAYYDILEQQNHQLMLYAHDAKNHLSAIRSLTDDPRIHAYIGALSQQLAEHTRNCHSGNKLLDVMIGKYTLACEQKGIRFDYDVRLCNLSTLEDMDLVAILGNLMDNSLAAAEDSADKYISLATARRNHYSILVLTNSCSTAPDVRDGRLVTSKPDRHLHGFGLTSVEKVLGKYQGDYEWAFSPEEMSFTVTVMIGEVCK